MCGSHNSHIKKNTFQIIGAKVKKVLLSDVCELPLVNPSRRGQVKI